MQSGFHDEDGIGSLVPEDYYTLSSRQMRQWGATQLPAS